MGHFVIILPNNGLAEVRFGTIRKKQFLSLRNILSGNWRHAEKRKGYIVTIDQHEKIMLFKTMEGEWINESNNEQYAFWQEKIDEFEKQNSISR